MTERPLVPTREDLKAFQDHTRELEELATMHDLAPEAFSILEAVSKYHYAMELEFSHLLSARIRAILRVVKESTK